MSMSCTTTIAIQQIFYTTKLKNKSKRMYFIFRKRPLLQNLLDLLKQFLMLKKIVTLTNDNYLATLGSM